MSHCNMRDLFKKAEVTNLMVMAGALKTISHCGDSSKTITTLFNNSNIVAISFHYVVVMYCYVFNSEIDINIHCNI